jgi:SAM-dependent methyltransferase
MAAITIRTRYAAAAERYHRNRPSYPKALIDWVLAATAQTPGARIADIGCGTGIATRLFAERGFATVGVDPSQEMLAFAHNAGLAQYVCAEAAATSLATGSIDLITAAQCFHWFDVEPTLREFQRVLRPDGWCATFWNLRASTPVMDEYDRLLRTYSSEYGVLAKQEAAPDALRAVPAIRKGVYATFENAQTLDREGLFGRAYSSSCVEHGVQDKAAFERALLSLFERRQENGTLEFRYRTVGVCWQIVRD